MLYGRSCLQADFINSLLTFVRGCYIMGLAKRLAIRFANTQLDGSRCK